MKPSLKRLIFLLGQALHAALAADALSQRPSQKPGGGAVYQLRPSDGFSQQQQQQQQQEQHMFNFAAFDVPAAPFDPVFQSGVSFFNQNPVQPTGDAGLSFLS